MHSNLTKHILIGMVAGILLGGNMQALAYFFPENALSTAYGNWFAQGLFHAGGQIFVNSLKLLVVPLVFVSLVCGTAALGENSRMGVIATKTIALYIATTCIAITLALSLSSLVDFGFIGGLPGADEFSTKEAPPLMQVFVGMFPTNPVAAMADGNMLQIIVFSILFGIAISKAGEAGTRLTGFFNDLDAAIMKMVNILMALAPYGVFCLLAKLSFTLDMSAFAGLLKYFFTLALILVLHGVFVYGSIVSFLAKLNPITFAKKMWPAQTMAFATSSSSATMPVTMEVVEEKIGVNNSVASFTVPLGATINMDGTAIMQGVATVFIAQIYGIDLTLSGFLTVILTATLASIGTAGVPGVGLITLTMVLTQAGLPVEGVAIILGVDRLLDMIRTAVNVTGDAAVSTVVAVSEKQFDHTTFNQQD